MLPVMLFLKAAIQQRYAENILAQGRNKRNALKNGAVLKIWIIRMRNFVFFAGQTLKQADSIRFLWKLRRHRPYFLVTLKSLSLGTIWWSWTSTSGIVLLLIRFRTAKLFSACKHNTGTCQTSRRYTYIIKWNIKLKVYLK